MRKSNKDLNIVFDDYINRAHLPDLTSVSKAKAELKSCSHAPYYVRKGIITASWSFALIAVCLLSVYFFSLFPPQTTYAENRGLEVYVSKTFSKEMTYEVIDCYDVMIGETAVGAIINMIASPDERRGGDEIRIVVEYSERYVLADSRFNNLPSMNVAAIAPFKANISLDNDKFLTLAAFLQDNIRVCVEIRSSENINNAATGNFDDYMGIFTMWPGLIKVNL